MIGRPSLAEGDLDLVNSTIRWREGRPDHLNRQSSQRHARGGQGGGRGNQNANNWGGARERDLSAGPQQEQHVPVLGFNAAESKAALRRGMLLSPSMAMMLPA